LNIIFGLVHATYEDVINHTTTALTPGTRSSRVEGGPPVFSASVEMVSNRTDWLRVKFPSLHRSASKRSPKTTKNRASRPRLLRLPCKRHPPQTADIKTFNQGCAFWTV